MYKSQVQIQRIWLSISIKMSQTSYHCEITTSEKTMHVFGTVMSHSDEGVLIDLWCPEEPCLAQKVIVSQYNIQETVEELLRERMERLIASDSPYTIQLLSY